MSPALTNTLLSLFWEAEGSTHSALPSRKTYSCPSATPYFRHPERSPQPFPKGAPCNHSLPYSQLRGMQHIAFENRKPPLSQLQQIHSKSKALSILPLPQSVLSLPFPASSRVNKRHIYSAWLCSEVEQEVLAAWQPKGEAVPAFQRKHLKTFKGCSVKKNRAVWN